MYAMLQQQMAQNAKMERAFVAIAERLGAIGTSNVNAEAHLPQEADLRREKALASNCVDDAQAESKVTRQAGQGMKNVAHERSKDTERLGATREVERRIEEA